MTEKPRNDAEALLDGIDKTLSDVKTKAYQAKKAYDQSDVGRAHRELTALGRFWSQFVRSCGWIYARLIEREGGELPPPGLYFVMPPSRGSLEFCLHHCPFTWTE